MQKWRSLIICEGVSAVKELEENGFLFPHYMWGCITSLQDLREHEFVPSLYVRVYRRAKQKNELQKRSLIICEGVSGRQCRPGRGSRFPHYMWGCIVPIHLLQIVSAVPSLYVRVYHSTNSTAVLVVSSLIICEGVSLDNDFIRRHIRFPHYMWGCIGKFFLI